MSIYTKYLETLQSARADHAATAATLLAAIIARIEVTPLSSFLHSDHLLAARILREYGADPDSLRDARVLWGSGISSELDGVEVAFYESGERLSSALDRATAIGAI